MFINLGIISFSKKVVLMADDEEYEIMPHRTIENIKKELESLKIKAAAKETISTESFRKSLDNLSVSMNSLTHLFNRAAQEMKIEEETENEIKGMMGPLMERLESLENENKAIAKAILAVADLIEERLPRKERIIPQQPEREIISRTYRETIQPKGMNLPPLRPIEESRMQSQQIQQGQVQHTFGTLSQQTPPPLGGPLPQQFGMMYPGAERALPPLPPAPTPMWRGPMPAQTERQLPLPPPPGQPNIGVPLFPANLPPLGPAPAPARKGLFR
jgi:hypothetical protein